MQTGRKPWFLLMLSAVSLSVATANDQAVVPPAAAPAKAAVFSVHDRDQDGYLDKAEYQQMQEQLASYRRHGGCDGRRKRLGLSFDDIDADTNGYISEDEMVASLNKRLRKHRRHRYHGGHGAD